MKTEDILIRKSTMFRINPLLIALLFIGCVKKENKSDDLFQIYNSIMNHEIKLIRICEQYYDEKYSYENVPEGIFIRSVPPFDSMPCITVISGNLEISNEYLKKICVVFKLESTLNRHSPHVNPITYKRANIYLNSIAVNNISLDVSKLDIYKAGVDITENYENCKNPFSNIYNFSYILLNPQKDKAVVFCYLQGHAEQKAAYFLKKIGDIWYLEIKEIM